MQIKHRNTIFLFSLSVILHLTILIVAGLFFFVPVTIESLGTHKNNQVSSYLYQNPSLLSQTNSTQSLSLSKPSRTKQEESFASSISTINLNKATQIKIPLKKNNAKTAFSSKRQASEDNSSHHTDELLILLHSAIQQKQEYPASALELERQGRITIKFTLLINGNIQNEKIIKSSGTPSLDEAALAAVRDAAPFQGINKYLHHPHDYTIDVVFEIT